MLRMKWWLLLFLVSHNITCKNFGKSYGLDTRNLMSGVNRIVKNGNTQGFIKAMEDLERILEETEVNETISISVSHAVAFLHKPKYPFKGLEISASENEVMSDKSVTNHKVGVRLPRELNTGSDNTISFCLFTFPETDGIRHSINTICGGSGSLYENRLVTLRVRGKTISELHECVNITINLTVGINETQKPRCVFYNFSEKAFRSDGCLTLWERGQSHITCSCNHLTYFAVLIGPVIPSREDQKILTYITLVGCSLSLFALVITVFLFITNRKIRADVSMKIHINLAIALILLNVHFLSSQSVAAKSSNGLCIYMALFLHYSLLATFSWMTLEGFHLYLVLVRVFNIYIKRYMLKLSVVGWGIPAVIVSLVAIIDRDAYGPVSLDSSNFNNSEICYIANDKVKIVTTVGVFGLVFIFNAILFGVTARHVVSLHHSKGIDCDRAKQDICTLLGVTILLGLTWGMVFFSFGHLTTPGLYLFCILNPLQGFFIFLWFLMSLRKYRNSATERSSSTHNTNR